MTSQINGNFTHSLEITWTQTHLLAASDNEEIEDEHVAKGTTMRCEISGGEETDPKV